MGNSSSFNNLSNSNRPHENYRSNSIHQSAAKSQMDPILEARSFLFSHALDASRIASLSWEDFLKYMSGLNEKCRNVVDSRGKYLLFAIKKGSHDTYLWKATVRICCLKMNSETGKVESRKFLTLPQFLRLNSSLLSMLSTSAVPDTTQSTPSTPLIKRPYSSSNDDSARTSASVVSDQTTVLGFSDDFCSTVSDSETVTSLKRNRPIRRSLAETKDFGASILLDRLDSDPDQRASDIESNCIICMERKPDVLLPCTHCYCLPCIEQWNDGHPCCPICRDKIDSTDDAWVLSDFPEQDDFTDYLLTLADEHQ